MFAVTDGARTRVSLKTTEIAYEVLTSTGRARRAPYTPEGACWALIENLGHLDDAEVAG